MKQQNCSTNGNWEELLMPDHGRYFNRFYRKILAINHRAQKMKRHPPEGLLLFPGWMPFIGKFHFPVTVVHFTTNTGQQKTVFWKFIADYLRKVMFLIFKMEAVPGYVFQNKYNRLLLVLLIGSWDIFDQAIIKYQ